MSGYKGITSLDGSRWRGMLWIGEPTALHLAAGKEGGEHQFSSSSSPTGDP